MSGHHLRQLPFLVGLDGRVIGVKQTNGLETMIPTLSADFKNLVDPLGNTIALSGGGGGVVDTVKGIKNLKRGNTSRVRAAMARGISGGGPARVMRIGDSTTAGAGAGTNSSGSTTGCAGAFAGNPMSRLNTLLQTANVASSQGGFVGSAYVDTSTYPAYDPRVSLNNFAVNNVATLGGFFFLATTAGATASFSPGRAINRIRVFFAGASPNGSFTVNVDGGAALTSRADSPFSPSSSVINTATAQTSMNYVDFDAPLGIHAINVVTSSATQVFLAGIQTWASSDVVNLMSMSHWGKKVGDITVNSDPWSPLNAISKYTPDLTIVSLTINDTTQGTSKVSYQSSLETILIEALKYGDVMLGLGAVSNDISSTSGGLYNTQSAVNELAEAYDLPVLSFPAVALNYAYANSQGWMFDGVHPTGSGYAREATAAYGALKWMIDNATA